MGKYRAKSSDIDFSDARIWQPWLWGTEGQVGTDRQMDQSVSSFWRPWGAFITFRGVGSTYIQSTGEGSQFLALTVIPICFPNKIWLQFLINSIPCLLAPRYQLRHIQTSTKLWAAGFSLRTIQLIPTKLIKSNILQMCQQTFYA